MKLPKIFKSKKTRERELKELKLIEDFENGKILNISKGRDKDNINNDHLIPKK